MVGMYYGPTFNDLVVLLSRRFTAVRAEVAVMLRNIVAKIGTPPPARLSLVDLPPHLIWHILAHVDPSESGGIYATCRAFRRARDDAKTLSTDLLHSSVMESMLFAHATDDFSCLEHLSLNEQPISQPYIGPHWAYYAPPFLSRSMPALRSLSLAVHPAIEFADNQSPMRTYYFPFETPGLGGFLDVPTAHESTAKPMPNLESLTVDCSDLSYQEYTIPQHVLEDSHNYHVPLAIFAHGTARLRRCLLRGIAWPDDQLVGAFRSLKSFAYAGSEELDNGKLQRIVEAMPALQSLRLHLSRFSDTSRGVSSSSTATVISSGTQEVPKLVAESGNYSTRFARLRHVLVGLNGRWGPNHEVEQSLTHFFVRNGAPDIVLILASNDEHDFRTWNAKAPEELLRVSEMACGMSNVSFRFTPDIATECGTMQPPSHRTRILGAGVASGAYMARSALNGISLAHLTALSISEHFARGILDDAVDQWNTTGFYLGQSPMPNQAPQMKFPALQRLTVWLVSCFENRRSIFIFSPGPGGSRLLEDRISPTTSATFSARFPRLSTFELSAGTRPQSTAVAGSRQMLTTCLQMDEYLSPLHDFPGRANGCICDRHGGGYVTSLYDLTEFLVDCAFPRLSCVRVCAIELIDYDLASTFIATHHALPNVEWIFDAERAPCDVESVDLYTLYGAEEIFDRLEGR